MCLAVVVLRLLLRALPRRIAELQRNLVDFQVCPQRETVTAYPYSVNVMQIVEVYMSCAALDVKTRYI